MTDPAPAPQTNLDRLKQQMKKDSLAARLVSAQLAAGPAGGQAALRKIMSDRLAELRQAHAGTPNNQN